tara:strand:+ start:285 stop:1076 length:792 start_codon:yes stop_codon:yes gene_type:complete
MKNIKFSIIVVSLNTKLDFIFTLKSIEKQTFKNYEIIVVDGDSNDGTIEEISKYKNIISKSIIEKDNGIYDAMNKGIDLSDGEWIIFMNSGDTFFDENVLEQFKLNNYSEFEIVYGDTVINTNEFNYFQKSKNFTNKTLIMPFCHQSVFVKSELLKEKKFSTNYKLSSDFDFFVSCFLEHKKFKKIYMNISKVKSGGFADINRQKVYNENIKIIKKNYNNTKNYYLLYFIKFFQYFKDIIKIFFPKKIIILILKIKYKKKLKK